MGRRLQLRDEDCPFAAAPFSKRPRYTANHEASLRSRTRCHHAGLHTSTLFRLFGSWSLVTGHHWLGLASSTTCFSRHSWAAGSLVVEEATKAAARAHLAHSLQMPCHDSPATPSRVRWWCIQSVCGGAACLCLEEHPSFPSLCLFSAAGERLAPLVPGPIPSPSWPHVPTLCCRFALCPMLPAARPKPYLALACFPPAPVVLSGTFLFFVLDALSPLVDSSRLLTFFSLEIHTFGKYTGFVSVPQPFHPSNGPNNRPAISATSPVRLEPGPHHPSSAAAILSSIQR